MSTMRGVVLPGDRQLEVRALPTAGPQAGQVLVRMKASSLCASDLRAISRPTGQGHGPEAHRGVIAGHQPCGIFERVGPGVRNFAAADRVPGTRRALRGAAAGSRGGGRG